MRNSFRYEAEMLDPVSQWLDAEGLLVQPEYATPAGPCDFVGVAFRREAVERRLGLDQIVAVRNVRKLALLQLVPDVSLGKGISAEELATELTGFIEMAEIKTITDWLVENGFVRNSAGGFQRMNQGMPLEERIVAVEVKLHRIWDAVHQAFQRQSFATEAIIAIPAARAFALTQSSRRRTLCEGGIGVLAVAGRGCELVLAPSPAPKTRTHPVLRALCVERFWDNVIRA